MSESESENQPIEPLNPEPVVPDYALLPPAAGAGAPAPIWSSPPTTAMPIAPAHSLWQRIAAYVVLAAVVAAAAGAGIGWTVARWTMQHSTAQSSTQSESPIVAGSGSTSSGNQTTASIAAKVTPAIVDIYTTVGGSSAAGTGMIITSSGEVLTNHHVVAQSSTIKVSIQGRSQQYVAHVIGVDPSADVALIQIDGVSGLPTVKFAQSSTLSVGATVVALGNALGAGGAPHVTRGSIVALDQSITASEGGGQSEQLDGLIQSDAVIYPGDSGGAIVNTSGQVVGMITAGQASGFRSSATTIGYAIPSDTAVSVVNRIRAHEQSSDLVYSQVGYLGVSVQALDQQIAAQLGLNVTSGVLVSSVVSGSPADNAGLARFSVITNLGGTTVDTTDSLGTAIRSHQPGDQVSLTWVASDGSHTTSVTLGGVNP